MRPAKISLAFLLTALSTLAEDRPDPHRFIETIRLPAGQKAVVAEGDYEPRSLGSYSVRLYGASPGAPFDNFLDGTIRRRPNGSIEKVELADIDGRPGKEIVVVFRCVGSGSFLSAEAFAFDTKRPNFLISVHDLSKDANTTHELRKAWRKQKR